MKLDKRVPIERVLRRADSRQSNLNCHRHNKTSALDRPDGALSHGGTILAIGFYRFHGIFLSQDL